jgi:fucose permease
MTTPEHGAHSQGVGTARVTGETPGIWDTAQARRFRAGATGAFFLLGLFDSMLGVVWPSMRSHLQLPIDALGSLLLGATVGFLVSSSASGWLLRRRRLAPILIGGTGAQALACAAIGAGFNFPSLVACFVCLGLCSGLIQAALSAAVSLWGRNRLMNALHGSYGAGAAVAPLVVTAALALWSWRLAFYSLGVFQILMALWWVRHRPVEAIHAARLVTSSQRRRLARKRFIGLGLLTFFFASGVEMAAASWMASYLEGRWLLRGAAVGLSVFCYWIALAGSRLTAALARDLDPARVVLASVVLVIAGSAAVWAAPDVGFAIGSLALLGFGTGPLLPALTSLTPRRVGMTQATGAIGRQIGAGSLGASGCSACAGFVLQHEGFSATGPVLTGFALVLAALVAVMHRAPTFEVPASIGGSS